MFAKMIPLSSLGTKPVGVVFEAQTIPTIASASNNTGIHFFLYKKAREWPYLVTVALKPLLNKA